MSTSFFCPRLLNLTDCEFLKLGSLLLGLYLFYRSGSFSTILEIGARLFRDSAMRFFMHGLWFIGSAKISKLTCGWREAPGYSSSWPSGTIISRLLCKFLLVLSCVCKKAIMFRGGRNLLTQMSLCIMNMSPLRPPFFCLSFQLILLYEPESIQFST